MKHDIRRACETEAHCSRKGCIPITAEPKPAPKIVALFGHDTPTGKCIDGVELSDGTRLKVDDVSPAMWATAGIVQADGKPLGSTQ